MPLWPAQEVDGVPQRPMEAGVLPGRRDEEVAATVDQEAGRAPPTAMEAGASPGQEDENVAAPRLPRRWARCHLQWRKLSHLQENL
jgi:hypothetical protein